MPNIIVLTTTTTIATIATSYTRTKTSWTQLLLHDTDWNICSIRDTLSAKITFTQSFCYNSGKCRPIYYCVLQELQRKGLYYLPLRLKPVTTLPCEIWMFNSATVQQRHSLQISAKSLFETNFMMFEMFVSIITYALFYMGHWSVDASKSRRRAVQYSSKRLAGVEQIQYQVRLMTFKK